MEPRRRCRCWARTRPARPRATTCAATDARRGFGLMYLSDAIVRGLQARDNDVLMGRFELLEVAGRGGMGVVYRARDRERDAIVALKLLAPPLADVKRFERESAILARLRHPHVVAYVCHGTLEEGDHY